MVESKLGKILLQKGLVTETQLRQAIARHKETGKMLGEVLSELGFVSPDNLARALADQLGIPFYELGEDFRLEKAEVKLVPEAVARREGLVPVKKGFYRE